MNYKQYSSPALVDLGSIVSQTAFIGDETATDVYVTANGTVQNNLPTNLDPGQVIPNNGSINICETTNIEFCDG